jgi:hypothetical protein
MQHAEPWLDFRGAVFLTDKPHAIWVARVIEEARPDKDSESEVNIRTVGVQYLVGVAVHTCEEIYPLVHPDPGLRWHQVFCLVDKCSEVVRWLRCGGWLPRILLLDCTVPQYVDSQILTRIHNCGS